MIVTEQCERYTVDPNTSWVLIGDKNEYIFNIKTNSRGQAGTVVKEHWKAGEGHSYPAVGIAKVERVSPYGPMWGDTQTYILYISYTLN